MLILGNQKQTSQKKYYTTLIFLIMLGHMQKVSNSQAQMKKHPKCQLESFCPSIIDG